MKSQSELYWEQYGHDFWHLKAGSVDLSLSMHAPRAGKDVTFHKSASDGWHPVELTYDELRGLRDAITKHLNSV